MQQIPPAELPDFKKHFTDLFHEFLKQDLKKYFAPYYNDTYTSVSKNKIGFHLWDQYKGIAYLIDDHIEEFTDKIFDQFTNTPGFVDFLYAYKSYATAMWKLKTNDFADALELHSEKTMAIYRKSSFRFNTEEKIKEFCKWLKNEKIWDQLYLSGETDKQKEICRLFSEHYINRLPLSSLPKTNPWSSWLQSITGWFKS